MACFAKVTMEPLCWEWQAPDAEIVELGTAIGQYIGFGRLLMVLDVEHPVCSLEDP